MSSITARHRVQPLQRRQPQRLGPRQPLLDLRPLLLQPRHLPRCRRANRAAGWPAARRSPPASPRASPPAPRTSPPRPAAAPPRPAAPPASAAPPPPAPGRGVAVRAPPTAAAGDRRPCRPRTAAPARPCTSHSRSATSSTRCGSWLTRITAPPYSVSASTSASRLSMSRWLVGSSRMIICGASSAASSSASRVFCPPDSRPTSVVDDIRADPARRQPPAQLPRRLVRPQPLQVLQRRLVELQLVHLMLGEIPHPELRGRHLPPAIGASRSESSFASVDFPCPFCPRSAIRSSWSILRFSPRSTGRPAIADAHVLQPDDRRRQLLRRREVERRHLVLDDGRDRLHPLQRLDPALRLPRLRRLRPEPVDEALHMRPRRVLLALLRHQLLQPRPPRVLEGVVGPLVEHQLLPIEMQDRPHRPVQQIPVVADHQHRMRIAREETLQPDRAFQVEIVRRLVQQQHVRPREQHRRQRHPHPPPAGELRAGPRLRRRIEPEPVQDRRRPRLRRMRVDVRQPRMDLGDPVRVLAPPPPPPSAPPARRPPPAPCRSGCPASPAPPAPPRRSAPAAAPRSRRRRAPARRGSAGRASSCRCPFRPTNPTLCPAGISAEASSKSFFPSIEKVMFLKASMAAAM